MPSELLNIDRYAVIGNPISHSLSPQIHQAFAAQSEQKLQYEAIEFARDNFASELYDLQQQGFKGVNITAPFKREAWELCDQKSPRAEDAGAVNTMIFLENGDIAGDNTDGIGLTRDLVTNHRALIKRRKILILGAGGAVRGVLGPLLVLEPEYITIANRTIEKAKQLVEDFQPLGDIKACKYESLGREKFDLIINATAVGLSAEVPPVPDEVLGINSICYDMMYNIHEPTAFVQWARSRGASRTFDGLGMLVEQAAESFYVWRGLRVETGPVIESLRK